MPSQQPALLTSWKEVAAYLGKGVRTVQRWEARLGMPVRRPDNLKSGIIQVSREELDCWLESRWSPRSTAKQTQEAPEGTGTGANSSNVVSINVAASRHLRRKQHELLAEVRRSLSQLQAECKALGSQMNCPVVGRAKASYDTRSDRKSA